MSIPVSCQCGQQFTAQPHLAGKVVLCPMCGLGINVPAQSGPQAYTGPPPPKVSPAGHRPQQQSSGGGSLVYLGVCCGVLVLFLIAAVAVTLIGYDVARAMLKRDKSAETATESAKAKSSPPPLVERRSSLMSPLAGQSSQPPFGFPSGRAMGSGTIFGPVVIFQVLDYRGTGDPLSAAQRALAGIPWYSGAVIVDSAAGEIVIGVRGSSVSTGEAKRALQAAGFQIGGTMYKPGGR